MQRKLPRVMLCALALLVGLLWAAPALAARADSGKAATAQAKDPRDTLSVTATVSPKGMAVPAETQVNITLVNGATEPICDIRIMGSDGKELQWIGDLSGSGSSAVFEEKRTPTNPQLKAEGIEYQVHYTIDKGKDTESRRKVTVLAPITRLQSEPALEFTRTPSATFAKAGDEVIITYRLMNTGNVPLTNMMIKDGLIGEIGRIESLGPGKKQRFTAAVVIDDNAESEPVVSYTYPGQDDRLSKKLAPITIYKADGRLEAQLDADQSAVLPGGEVNLQLKITNKGNVTYDKLEIKDDALGTIGPISVELKPGRDYVFAKRINIKSSTTFLFTINGVSATGASATAVSNMLTVALTPPADSINLKLSAEPDNAALSGPGTVNFSVNIHNAGEMDIRNVMLSELNHGEIKNLAVVAVGDTPVSLQYQVNQDETFQFMATVTDAKDDKMFVMSQPVKVEIVPSSEELAPAAPSQVASVLGIADTAYRMDEGEGMFRRMVSVVIVALAVLMLMLLVSSLVRYSRRRKQKRLLLKRLKKGRRGARGLDGSLGLMAASRLDDDTGVYRKTELVPRKETV